MDKIPDWSYRVLRTQHGWEITAFKGNEAVMKANYIDDALPDWVIKEVALLNLVDQNGSIAGIGHRVGTVYWLIPNGQKVRGEIYE